MDEVSTIMAMIIKKMYAINMKFIQQDKNRIATFVMTSTMWNTFKIALEWFSVSVQSKFRELQHTGRTGNL